MSGACRAATSSPRSCSPSDKGKPYDAAEFDQVVQAAVDEAVKKQVAAGVTIVSDGELGKVGYSTYVIERLSWLRRTFARKPALDLAAVPALAKKLATSWARQEFARAACVGPVKLRQRSSRSATISAASAPRSTGMEKARARS